MYYSPLTSLVRTTISFIFSVLLSSESTLCASIYLNDVLFIVFIWIFQCISCLILIFSGSALKIRSVVTVSIHPMLMFILLCGLRELGLLCFNTSHVNVYRGNAVSCTSALNRFNTSHVNVYRIL